MLPRFRITDSTELNKLHEASLRLLERTGMVIEHEEALALLADAGCRVERRERRVRFPPDLVTKQIQLAPRRVVLGGREPASDVVLGEGASGSLLRPALGLEQLLDYRTDQVRAAGNPDQVDWIRLADALPEIGFCAVLSPVDVHLPSRDVSSAAVALRHTTKHVHALAYSGAGVEFLAQMAQVVAGSGAEARRRPPLSFFQVSISPLQLTKHAVDKIWAAGRHGIPVFLNSSPIMGATGPISVAGCVALLNAEILAMNTLLQLAHPGSPIVYTIRSSAMDMKTTQSCWGMIEVSLAAALSVQLAKELYELPTDAYGPSTESKRLDVQSDMERVKMSFLPTLSGSDVVAGAGNLESQSTMSLPQLLLDAELFRSLIRMHEGVRIDDDELALDAIDAVGPKGNFLTCDHTLLRFRNAFEPTELFDRSFRAIWQEQGSPQVLDKVRRQLERIAATHQAEPLGDAQVRQIDEIAEVAAQTLYSVES